MDNAVYEINGHAIYFSPKFNDSLEPYYEIICKMSCLRLEGHFNKKFILMPNIKILFLNCRIANHLTLTKNIVSISTTCEIKCNLPINLIFFSQRSTCTKLKINVSKNTKYVFLWYTSQYITKLNKNMIQYNSTNHLDSLNVVNKKMRHLCLNNGNNEQIDLPKNLITLELDSNFNKRIILTPHIKMFVIKSRLEQRILLEHSIDVLKIHNGETTIIENIPNSKNKRFLEIFVVNKSITNNTPNDVEKQYRNCDVYLNNIIHTSLTYGCDDDFKNIILMSNERNRNKQIYLQLVKQMPITNRNRTPKKR